jgi:hypothetical protein
MTQTKTYTRQELALKRICEHEAVKINGRVAYLDAIIRIRDSYFVRWTGRVGSDHDRDSGVVPIDAVTF